MIFDKKGRFQGAMNEAKQYLKRIEYLDKLIQIKVDQVGTLKQRAVSTEVKLSADFRGKADEAGPAYRCLPASPLQPYSAAGKGVWCGLPRSRHPASERYILRW